VSDFLHLTSPRSAVDSAMGRKSEADTESIDDLLAQQQASEAPDGATTDTTADLAALTPKIRTPTPADPLTLLVSGASATETFGTSMVRISESTGLFKGVLDFHVSTGLAVPSYFNWPEHLVKDVIPNDDPDVVVIMCGANDGQ